MDRWKRAYTYLGFENLDHRRERFVVYGTTAVFCVNLAAWLITREGIIPRVDGPLEWLLLALLAIPGTARTAFLIALGPIRQGEWETSWVNPDPGRTKAPAPIPAESTGAGETPEVSETLPARKWWRVRMRVRGEFARRQRPRRQPKNSRPWTGTWANPRTDARATQTPPRPHQPPPPPAVPAQPRPRQGGSTAKTLVKILAVLALFAVCGGFWLTGGNIVSPSDSTTEPPRLRNVAEKKHMLELINDARLIAGVPPVVMGTNNVAQIQADNMLRDCVMSHWGTDGLKPYMRYSLAGGYQINGENASGHNECELADTWLYWNDEPTAMVEDTVQGWLESPGHRETMLNPEYRKVNIGLAWDRNTFKAIQHFEGDYTQFTTLPDIREGTLFLEGSLNPGYTFDGRVPLMAVIIYDPRPRRLTKGQLARTYCYGHGEYIGGLLPPSRLIRDELELTQTLAEPVCIDPYKVDRGTDEPVSQEENIEVFLESRQQSLRVEETELTLSFRKAEELSVIGNEFRVRADMSELLDEHGPGVYTVALLAGLEGGLEEPDTVISEYSIFHEVRTPTTYGTTK